MEKSKFNKKDWRISPILREHTLDWLLNKHYAHRVPSVIKHCFGLYDKNKQLQGVCTIGISANYRHNALGKYKILELSRLVVNEGLEKNTLSFFVSWCMKFLGKPVVLISFADTNNGHHGYIYQATNWIYTGVGMNTIIWLSPEGKEYHNKSMWVKYGSNKPKELKQIKQLGKHRYFMFLGNKKEKEEMKEELLKKYKIQPYPKGENKRYDASYVPIVIKSLL